MENIFLGNDIKKKDILTVLQKAKINEIAIFQDGGDLSQDGLSLFIDNNYKCNIYYNPQEKVTFNITYIVKKFFSSFSYTEKFFWISLGIIIFPIVAVIFFLIDLLSSPILLSNLFFKLGNLIQPYFVNMAAIFKIFATALSLWPIKQVNVLRYVLGLKPINKLDTNVDLDFLYNNISSPPKKIIILNREYFFTALILKKKYGSKIFIIDQYNKNEVKKKIIKFLDKLYFLYFKFKLRATTILVNELE